jgi:hypothetical protein
MAVARVVTFEGVSKDRMAELSREISEGDPPEGFPPAEIVVLHDPDTDQSLVIIFFENDEDYQQGDAVLDAMPASDTPGRRTSVKKHDVHVRMKS